MSSVSSSANRWWTFRRQTANVVDPVEASASVAVDRQPQIASYLQVRVEGGTTGSGTVTITGETPSGSTTDSLVFTANGTRVSTFRWKSVASITTTGLDGEPTVATIRVEAVSGDGVANLLQYVVAASRPVVFSASGASTYPSPVQGSHEQDGAKVLVDWEEAWTPRVDDLATDDQLGDTWRVQGVRPILAGFGYRPHHWEVRVSRYDT